MVRMVSVCGSVQVWSPKDWVELKKNRIVGNLVGALPSLPRQNNFNGLPSTLMNEEVSLILDKGLGQLFKLKYPTAPPSQLVKEEFSKYSDKINSELVSCLKEERKRHIETMIDKIVEGRQRKYFKRKTTGNEEEEEEELGKEVIMKQELAKAESEPCTPCIDQVFNEEPWYRDEDFESVPWPQDDSPRAQLRSKVFRDLWEKSYYVTDGLKFGGDFLAYPGDPMEYHSVFIVKCYLKDEKFSMLDLVTNVRLAKTTRKTLVIASTNDEGNVVYNSFKFSN